MSVVDTNLNKWSCPLLFMWLLSSVCKVSRSAQSFRCRDSFLIIVGNFNGNFVILYFLYILSNRNKINKDPFKNIDFFSDRNRILKTDLHCFNLQPFFETKWIEKSINRENLYLTQLCDQGHCKLSIVCRVAHSAVMWVGVWQWASELVSCYKYSRAFRFSTLQLGWCCC